MGWEHENEVIASVVSNLWAHHGVPMLQSAEPTLFVLLIIRLGHSAMTYAVLESD